MAERLARLWKKIGDRGKFQGLVTVSTILICLVYYYMFTCVPYQKVLPTVLCRLKGNEQSTFKICDKKVLCDPRYEIKIDKETSLTNWQVDFNLSCDTQVYFDYIANALFLGQFLNNILFSKLPDILGRNRLLTLQTLLICFMMVVPFFISHFRALIVWYLVVSLMNASFIVNLIYLNEVMEQRLYTVISSVSVLLYPVTGIIQGLLYKFVSNWRHIHFGVLVVAILSLLLLIYLPESPGYLFTNKKFKACLMNMRKIATVNGTLAIADEDLKNPLYFETNLEFAPLEQAFLEGKLEDESKTKPTPSIWNELRTSKTYRIEFLAMLLSLTISRLIFNSFIFKIENIDANVYMFALIVYWGEASGVISSSFLVQYFGRRTVLRNAYLTSAFCFLVFYFVFNFFWIKAIICYIVVTSICIALNTTYLYMPELFAPHVKAFSVLCCSGSSNLSLIFCVYVIQSPASFFYLLGLCLILAYLTSKCRETLIS